MGSIGKSRLWAHQNSFMGLWGKGCLHSSLPACYGVGKVPREQGRAPPRPPECPTAPDLQSQPRPRVLGGVVISVSKTTTLGIHNEDLELGSTQEIHSVGTTNSIHTHVICTEHPHV